MRRRILISNNGQLTLSKNSDDVNASEGIVRLKIYKNDTELSPAEYSAVTYTIESSSNDFISSIIVYATNKYIYIYYNANTDLTYGRTAQITFTFNNSSAVYTLTQSKDKLSGYVCIRDLGNLILTAEDYRFCKDDTTTYTASGYATQTTSSDYGISVKLVGEVDITYSYAYDSGLVSEETETSIESFEINRPLYHCSSTVSCSIYYSWGKVHIYTGGGINLFNEDSKFYDMIEVDIREIRDIELEKGKTYSNELLGYVCLEFRKCDGEDVVRDLRGVYFDGTVDNDSYNTNYTFRI